MSELALCCVDRCRKDAPPREVMPGACICRQCEDVTWENLRTVTKLWPLLKAAVPAQGGGGEHVSGTKEPGLVINVSVVDAEVRVEYLMRFWAHVLLDERPTLATSGTTAGELASFIGANLRHLTRHWDEGLVVGFVADAREAAHETRKFAMPQRRTYRPGIPCVEHSTDEHGQRVPCGGEYQAKVTDGMGYVPDLVCSIDAGHVMTPGGFRTLGRVMDKGGAERLLGALSGKVGA